MNSNVIAPEFDSWVDYIPYGFVGTYAILMLVFGSIAAFSGRKTDAKRKELIERIILTFWSAVVPLIFKAPALSLILGTAGVVFASYASGRYKHFIYPLIGAIAATLIAYAFIVMLPAVDILSLIGIFVLVLSALLGYHLGERYRDWLKIITTTYAGASMFTSGLLAIAFIVQWKPWLFIQNTLVSSLVPVIGGLLENQNLTWYESVGYWVSFSSVLILGFRNQRAQYMNSLNVSKLNQ
jgi:hypothetical protein